MLENKASCGGDAQADKNYDSPQNPTGSNRGRVVELIKVPEFFPMTSNDVSRDTRITAGQISGPNQALTYKAAFRKVFSFGFISHEPRVSGWSWGTKSSNSFVFGFKTQRILGIDSSNRGPAQGVCLEDVVNNNSFFTDFYAWIPKKQPSKISEPNVNPGFSCDQEPRIYDQRGNSKKSKDESGNGHYATRSGVQGLGVHLPSLTQLSSHRVECY